jgi:hypothetical protein
VYEALVRHDRVDSVWDAWTDALQAGYRFFGEVPFMVKEVLEEEPVIYNFNPLLGPYQRREQVYTGAEGL